MATSLSGTSMRSHNEALILRLLQEHHQLARSHLAAMTGLTPAAIGRIVDGLSQRELIEEVGIQATGKSGRPVTLLQLARQWIGIGVDVRVDRTTLSAIDVNHNTLMTAELPVPEQPDPSFFVDLVDCAVKKCLAQGWGAAAGIGLVLPAVTDHQRMVCNSLYFGWQEVPIVDMLEQRAQIPVGLRHVAEAAAVAHATQPEAQQIQRLLHVQLGIGMGMALTRGSGLDETLPVGWGGAGHVLLGDRSKRCRCGRYGCVDTLVGFPAFADLVHQCCAIRWDGAASSMATFCQRLASTADREATVAINSLADELARILAVFITIEAPEAVTLGGYPLLLGTRFKQRLAHQLDSLLNTHFPIIWTALGDKASTVGAALLGLAQLGRKLQQSHR